VFADERTCPHCGAPLRSAVGIKAVVIAGLALTGCPTAEPAYGVPDTGTDGGSSDEVESTGESGSDSSTSESSTDTGTSDSTTTSAPDTSGDSAYGLPDSGG
jgi:hypothetical protein